MYKTESLSFQFAPVPVFLSGLSYMYFSCPGLILPLGQKNKIIPGIQYYFALLNIWINIKFFFIFFKFQFWNSDNFQIFNFHFRYLSYCLRAYLLLFIIYSVTSYQICWSICIQCTCKCTVRIFKYLFMRYLQCNMFNSLIYAALLHIFVTFHHVP